MGNSPYAAIKDSDERQLQLVESDGAWPFTTVWRFRYPQGASRVHHSRHLRKSLHSRPQWIRNIRLLTDSVWMPRELNWWIGVIFALGATLFALGSILFLFPGVASHWSVSEDEANLVFFLGSIPFTTAAYLQLMQAANADHVSGSAYIQTQGFTWVGWRPRDAGWLSCALQFLGTLLFNINTFDALHPGSTWIQQDLTIWIPNMLGSLLFLSSGYLAFIEVCHAYWAWQPRHISWWICAINLLGCIAFMISAVFGFAPPQSPAFDAAALSLWFTLAGAISFLVGALLLLPETSAARELNPG